MKRLVRCLLVLLGVVVLGMGASWMHLQRSLPKLSGHVATPGLSERLELVRDRHAVMHVYASAELDAYFGLGYAHAEDRLWQMEVARRLGSGTLAEIFGADVVRRDRLFRTLGLRRVAEQNLSALGADARAALEAYARGVNASLANGAGRRPPEFVLLRVEPGAWSPVDSLVILKLMAFTLSTNFSRELLRLRLSQRLSPRDVAELMEDPFALPELRNMYAAVDGTAKELLALSPARRHAHLGSNNWVVDGARTASGKPLLANDPHLDLTAPTLWYLAHLQAAELNVIGATIPGVPAIVLGRNDHVAWGFTNTESDTQDLFIEKLAPSNPGQYSSPTGPRPFTTIREVIKIKGAKDEVLTVRVSRNGPVISDVQRRAGELAPEGHVIALRWVALEGDDRTLQFPLRAAHARTAEDVLSAAVDFHCPQQNIVYADAQGHIGFVAAGRVPRRLSENDIKGLAPMPGWLTKYEWQGFVPFSELPQASNAGRFVTANNDVAPPGYQHWLTSEWASPYRADRIARLLDETNRHTVQSFARIQLDVKSGVAAALLSLLLRTPPSSELEREVLQRLRAWNGDMKVDAPEPLLFAVWIRELTRSIYGDELGDMFPDVWGDSPEFLKKVLSHTDGHEHWCNDVTTTKAESCDEITAGALHAALAWAQEQYGSDWKSWSWGAAHSAYSKHTPLGELPLLGSWTNIVTPTPGDNETINLAGYSLDEEAAPFASHHGPGLRTIYDLNDPQRSVFIISTGQSGHPLSNHYDDLSELWATGQYIPMTTERSLVEAGALGTLVLSPR